MGTCMGSQRHGESDTSYRPSLPGSHFRPATVFPGQDQNYSSYRTNGILPFPEGLFIDGVNHRRILTHQTPKISNTETVRSLVNLKKSSLKLFKESEISQKYKISFLADSTLPCKVFIYVMAYDKDHIRTDNPPRLKSKITKRIPSLSGKLSGLDQTYSSSFEESLSFDDFSEDELTAIDIAQGSPFPVIIRLQTENESLDSEPSADTCSKLSNSMQAQTTYCTLTKQSDGSYGLNVVKQVLWVGGVSYLLKEIFGIDKGEEENAEEDQGRAKECVICMSEARDTLALPCRHLCLCIDCAKTLRYQTNKCPICRSVIQSLLQITINSTLDKFTSTVTVPVPSMNLQEDQRKNELNCSRAPRGQSMNECARA